MSTNLTKWDDTANELTAYCDDDSAETEIGPAKWDDANNKLEINCDSTDFQVKWDDANNRLEARNVAAGCCVCDTPCNLSTSEDINVTFSSIVNCPSESGCDTFNGNTYTCVWESVNNWWRYYNAGTSTFVVVDCTTNPWQVSCGYYTPLSACFYAGNLSDCLTANISNGYADSGDCSPGFSIDGYSGNAEVAIAP